jgi:hypothetical protein
MVDALARDASAGEDVGEDDVAEGLDDTKPTFGLLSFFIGWAWSSVLGGSESTTSSRVTRFLFGTKTSAGLIVGSIGGGAAGLW